MQTRRVKPTASSFPQPGRGEAGTASGAQPPPARVPAHLPRDSARRLTYCAPRSAVQAASRALRLVLMRPPAADRRTVAQSPLSPPLPARPSPASPPAPRALSHTHSRSRVAPRSSAAQAPPVNPAPTTSTRAIVAGRDRAEPRPVHAEGSGGPPCARPELLSYANQSMVTV